MESNNRNPGIVYWITGLSGSGKSTLSIKLGEKLKSEKLPFVIVDGDAIRKLYDDEKDYSRDSRLKTAWHYSKLAKFISDQEINVICATISLFHEIQDWNRKNIQNYKEIFLDIPIEELKKQDNKQIYSRAKKGELINVVGIDIEAEFPKNPEFRITEQKPDYYNSLIQSLYKL